MKEKINLLSKGIFEYGCPDIHVSEKQLSFEVEAGSSFSSEFSVYSTNGICIRAKVFSSNKQMHCEETDIIGKNNRIHYTFSAENMESGDQTEGHISVISNGGEIQIPYRVHVCEPFYSTSIGEICNLDEFTQLAESNWSEAVNLFKSSNFAHVFLVNKIHVHMYEKLIRSKNIHQALEEFLVTLKKKDSIFLSIKQREIIQNNLTEALSDKLVIEKNTWGFQEIFIDAEGDFLSVYKKRLTTQDFLGSYYELEYFINPDFLRPGHNHGRIILETFFERIEIRVSCFQELYRDDEIPRATIDSSVCHLSRRYLDWSAGRIDRRTWIKESREDVDCCRNHSDALRYALLEAHFLFTAGEEKSAMEIMTQLYPREIRKKSLLEYSYYLYITTFYRKELDYRNYVVNRIREMYEGPCDRWELLWFLIQLDERLRGSQSQIYKQIKYEYMKGCHSPFMYQEALKLANEDPSLIRTLDSFEVQLMHWGVRHDLLSERLISQYADMSIRERVYHPLLLKALLRLCKKNESKELLAAVCSMLIKGNKLDPEYNSWYLKGIQASLNLTRIYEYYMLSLDETTVKEIPSAVLFYFNYNNRLEWSKKAFLYRYIIENRQKLQRIFLSYDNIIKAFTFEQLSLGNIDEHLSELYKFYITKDKMNQKLAKELPDILFKHQVSCNHPGIVNVLVTMRELNKEFVYPIVNGKAYIDLFMDEYNIAFEDRQGNRYMQSIDYSIKKLMDDSEFVKECYELYPENGKILMNRSERALKYQMIDDVSVEIFKQTLKISLIRNEYRKNILKNLIDIYYESYEGETLEKYLLTLDIHLLGSEERGSIIEYYIQRGFYEKAYEAINEYGYEDIRDKRLMRLTSRIIRLHDYAEDDLLLEMAFFTFKSGKYDEIILEYLNRYYMGTTKDYYDLWNAANVFEIQVHLLEEKMLCQVLFTENMLEESAQVFVSYYHAHPNIKIIKAYLAYSAYAYLTQNTNLRESIFHYMEIEMDQMERGRDICSLAMLKHFSEMDTENYSDNSWGYNEIRRFMSKGFILPWFKHFASSMDLPKELVDHGFALYITDPAHTVKIRYCIEHGEASDRWIEENMINVFGGIFVRSWPIFAGEKIIWQAMDDDGEHCIVTEKQEILPESFENIKCTNGMDYLNSMILQKDFNDYDTFCRTAYEYNRIKAISENVFHLH